MKTFRRVCGVLTLVWIIIPIAYGQGTGRPDLPSLFEKREVMIPMRDGVKLHTEIYTPKEANEALPIFLERTPYGISARDKGYSPILYSFAHMLQTAMFLSSRIFAAGMVPRASL